MIKVEDCFAGYHVFKSLNQSGKRCDEKIECLSLGSFGYYNAANVSSITGNLQGLHGG
jgi:hypothetical protein